MDITAEFFWKNEPKISEITSEQITIETEADTDLWQKTYYGFSRNTGHMLLKRMEDEFFTLTVKTESDSHTLYDQCGVVAYIDENNWFKASSEYENHEKQRLGSVVTRDGYSDWATQDIPADVKVIYYRVSRRRSDYRIEYSLDGAEFKQMRILHLDSAVRNGQEINVGIYACSPQESSFKAVFTELSIGENIWE